MPQNTAEKKLTDYLKAQEQKTLLRFITCGSVDDGKSTLIGRLLYEAKSIFADQLSALESDSAKMGTQGGELDFALLVDGLASEREQGITIDVAYRYFSSEKRKFIIADTPGHEQYTRNMVTGASTADLAIILVDAGKGILEQTRRHSFIASLLGIGQIVLAVNKMDRVDYSKEVFETIVADYQNFAGQLSQTSGNRFEITTIPLSALKGDNVIKASKAMKWYKGPSLLEHLENVPITKTSEKESFRMPVQWVSRPDQDFRGFCGQIASGAIKPGDAVKILPSARQSIVKQIITHDGNLKQAIAGQSVTLTLKDEIDISRGDVIAEANNPPEVADQFDAEIVWMSEAPMLPGRRYLLKIGTNTARATITTAKHRYNVNSLETLATKTLGLNEIGRCTLSLDRRIAFEAYHDNRELGSFILIDRLSNDTMGCGMIRFALRRSANIHLQAVDVSKDVRAEMKGQKPVVLWFTGLSGSGKSTIANIVEKKLAASDKHTYLLDGDNVRHGLNRDLGFTDADRVENIRRIAEVSKLMADAGLITLVSFISPFRSERQMARNMMEMGEFIEIFVDTPLAVAESRDVKGLYKKARAGEIKNFTGIDSPYEAPQNAEITVNTVQMSAEEAAEKILAELEARGVLSG